MKKTLMYTLLVNLLILCTGNTVLAQQNDLDTAKKELINLMKKNIPEENKIAQYKQLFLNYPDLKELISTVPYEEPGFGPNRMIAFLKTGLFDPNKIRGLDGKSMAYNMTRYYIFVSHDLENLKKLFELGGTLTKKELQSLKEKIDEYTANMNKGRTKPYNFEEVYQRLQYVQKLLNN